MKTKKLNKKLALHKNTIANLSREDMKVLGGAFSDYCTMYSPRCQGITKRDCPVGTNPYNCQTVTDCNQTEHATCGGTTCDGQASCQGVTCVPECP
jgi:hypothetical protein